MTTCRLGNTPVYCFASVLGELLFDDYFELKLIKRHLISRERILKVYNSGNSTIGIFPHSVASFSLHQFKSIGDRIPIDDGSVPGLGFGLLIFGYKDGSLDAFHFTESGIVPVFDIFQPHHLEVTGFGFGSIFFVSVSRECSL
jgi:hypothetical protein